MNDFFYKDVRELERIGCGGMSDVYLIEHKGKKYVKKVPNNKAPWLFLQNRAKFATDCFHNYYPNYPVIVPKMLFVDSNTPFSIETFVDGKELYMDLLSLQSSKEREVISDRLGKFLSDFHHMQINRIRHDYTVCDITSFKARKRLFKDRLYGFLKRNASMSRVLGVNHGDFCPQNILYDSKSGNVAVIDFGGVNQCFVNVDFNRMAKKERDGVGFPRDFAVSIINSYNESSRKKLKAKVCPKKIKWHDSILQC
ncbi:MAG: aminoglycoside phosphotransferase family protein [Alphaproteobacteria bacterium]|jgi:aminoglycoside phosphotransferase (APT) family kinase protein|nr:aminoglycoside phosphotransferase family protein [Alphaproteobacteria bacterium]